MEVALAYDFRFVSPSRDYIIYDLGGDFIPLYMYLIIGVPELFAKIDLVK